MTSNTVTRAGKTPIAGRKATEPGYTGPTSTRPNSPVSTTKKTATKKKIR